MVDQQRVDARRAVPLVRFDVLADGVKGMVRRRPFDGVDAIAVGDTRA